MKKFLFTRECHPGMKFDLKENLPLSMKTYNKIYHWYVETSGDYFFKKVTLFIIFRCLFSYYRISEAVARKYSVAQVLPCEFCKISKNILQNTSGGCFWHSQTWCHEIEQNRNYSNNLTTMRCGFNGMKFCKLPKENKRNNKNVFTFLIFYLLPSSFFLSDFTFYKEVLCFIIFIL